MKGTGVTCKNVVFKEGLLPESAVGDVVIAMGNDPLEELKKQGLVAKNRTIGSLRGMEKTLPSGASLFVSYSFSIRTIDYSLSIDLCGDIKLAVRKLLTGSVKPPPLDFQWVQDLTGVIEQLDAKVASSTKLVDAAIDLETTGLIAYDKSTWIVTFQISLDTKSSRVIHFEQDFQPINPNGAAKCRAELVWKQIDYILNHPRVSLKGANLKYDLNWIHEKWGIHCTNFKMDTLLVGSLLDENRSNSLKTHAHVYTIYGGYELELYNTYDIARPQDVPPDVLLPYCGYDTTVCLETAEKMKHELVTYRYPATLDGVGDIHDLPMLANFYIKILHPAARAYEEVEQVGVLVDVDYYKSFKRKLQSDTKDNALRALAMLPGRIKAKYRDNLDLSRAAMLGCYFFSKMGMGLKPVMFTPKPDKKTGLPKPSTAMEHFLKFEKNPVAAPFIKVVKEYKDISKTLSTYVVGFMKHLRYDGRFHAGYSLYRGALESDERDAGAVCFPAGELLLTNRGYLPIEDVKVNDLVISHTGEPKAVFDFIPNGIKPVKKITLSNGLSLRTTNNHPYLSNGAWVNAEDLKVGDSVTVHSDVEVWKPVPDWGYSVSSWGRVKSHYSGKIIKVHQKGKWGHLKVQFARNGSQVRGEDRKDFALHRLVALAFLPNPEGHTEVMHLNGVAWDNTVGNLAWGSGQTNRDDASQQGRLNKTRGSQAKLTWESVQLIRASTLSDGVLGKLLGVSRESVRDARTGKRWNKDPQWTYPNNFYEASVVCIEDQEPEPTFGVSVADNYSHVSGGVVTHNTGRISIDSPALQTVPKKTRWAKPLRRAYIAPPGFVVCNIDYGQGELRIAADLSGDAVMLNAYANDLDLHAVTGAGLAKIDFETFMSYKDHEDPLLSKIYEEKRQAAKGANFGLVYGMGAEGYRDYAEIAYRHIMTLEEATTNRDRFFETYKGLIPWHERYKEFAKKYGYTHSPLGRIRHLPLLRSSDKQVASKELRRAVNSPVQGCLSDMSLWATAIMQREGLTKKAPVVMMCHDALVFNLPEDNYLYYAKRYKEIMENLPFEEVHWKPKVKFVCDVEIGENWSQLVKLKL